MSPRIKSNSGILNKQYQTNVFAEATDIHGLPINGWSYPCFSIEREDGFVYHYVGVFRLRTEEGSKNNDIDYASEYEEVSLESYDPIYMKAIFKRLLRKLIQSLERTT